MTSSIILADSDLHTSSYIYTGSIDSITDTQILGRFDSVAAGSYVLYVEIAEHGFSQPSTNVHDDITVELVATAASILSSYAGGNDLMFTGFGFGADVEITVCG